MAVLLFTYCNASLNREIEVQYNDVTHAITSGVAGDSCPLGSTPLAANAVLYSHEDGGTIYTVRVKNSLPFAHVTSETPDVCDVDIDSVDITNATNNLTSDGALMINATGNGVLAYSINNGASYQSGPLFEGLPHGNYQIRVRNTHPTQGVCTVSQTRTVGFDSIFVCDLALGNVAVTDGPGGTIEVLSYSTQFQAGQPVEYRLDAGAWQDSALFTGLAAGTYDVQIRLKNYPSCEDNREVTLSTCDIFLGGVNVTHEQSKDGSDGSITVIATSSNGPIEYSIDDGDNYQASNIFLSLAPGTYQVRIKDALASCEAFQTVEIKKFRAPYLEFGIANAMRVVITAGSTLTPGAKQNFDNTLFSAMHFKDVAKCEYFQKWSTSDLITLQYRSSFEFNTVKLYTHGDVPGVDEPVSTLVPVKKSSFFDKTEAMAAYFSNYGAGKTQVYFPDTGLPSFIKVGMNITISGQATLNGTYEVEDIVNGTGEAEGYLVLLITKTYTSGTDPLAGTVSVTYDVEDFEIWQLVLDASAQAAGDYFLLFEGTDGQFGTYTARSEPIRTLVDVSDLVKVKYKNFDTAFKIDYTYGIEHLLRLEGELIHGAPGGEREEMEDSRRRLINLRENVTRRPQFNADGLPPYLGEKLRVAFAHDFVEVDDLEVQKSEELDVRYHHDAGDPFCTVSCALRQVDFIAENADDRGDVDATILELGDGQVMEIEP